MEWDKAFDKTSKKGDGLKWIPINYEDSFKPAIVMWDDKTSYKKDLLDKFIMPTIEGFIVFKDKNNKLDGFLARIAYDPYVMRDMIRSSNLTGTLLLTDWEENIKYGAEYLGGKLLSYYDSFDKHNKNSKVAGVKDWFTYPVHSQTVVYNEETGAMDYTYYTTMQTVWIPSGQAPIDATLVSTDFNYFGNLGGGSSSPAYGYSANGTGYLPPITNYNPQNIVTNIDNSDKTVLLDRLNKVMFATGLAVSTLDFSISKATAIVQGLGIDPNPSIPNGSVMGVNLSILGKSVSGLSVGLSTYTLIIGISQDGFTWEGDGINLLQVGLGVAAIATGGWIAVTIGAASVAIAIATAPE